jgi:glutamine synthetase
MFKTFAEAAEFVRENDVRMVDLKFSDLWGRWHHVTISAREFTPALLTEGVGFDGSSVGFKSVKSGDMVLVPDLSSGFMDPFWDSPTLAFLCNILEADTKEIFARDPREIARRAEKYLVDSKIADESIWGPELEFYVFDKVEYENNIHTAHYSVDSSEANWNGAAAGHGHYNPVHGGYHITPPRDNFFNLRSQMVEVLEDVGVPVKYHHHEVGGPGQCEIETPLMGMLAAADASMMIKYVTRMVAHEAGYTVTFLPKPLFGEAGSGMHFHQLLRKGGKNTFFDAAGQNLLSQTALYYIGGLLTHAPAVIGLTNPSTNSYRRLVPGFEAPVNCFFSSGNRSAAIRVPKYATEPEKVRFEFRPPDATCNPYLAEAAMLMAGIDGIQKKIDPTKAGFGPIDEDIFSWPVEKRKTIHGLPTSLEEALCALHDDQDFLLSGGVFSADMLHDWIKAKRGDDLAVRARPHPYEVELYYDL